MSVPLIINGVTFNYPQQFDLNWGPTLTNWSTAVTNGMLQKAGGAFTLTSEVDFGASFGLKVLSLKSKETNIAATGILRLANASTGVVWRNALNSADLALTVNSSNQLTFNGINVGAATSLTDSHIFVGNASNQPADVAMSGDITIANTGVTAIGSKKVLIGNINPGTANQLMGANSGATATEYKTLSGTANRVTVTNGVGTITLSSPQDIATSSTPTFSGLTLSAADLVNTWLGTAGRNLLILQSTSDNGLFFNNTGNASGSRVWSWIEVTGSNCLQLTLFNDAISSPLFTGIIQANNDGSVTLNTGNLKMNSHKVTGVTPGAASGEATTYGAVTGSSANSGGTQGAITQGTVSTPDLRAGAVSQSSTGTTSVTLTTTGGAVMVSVIASALITTQTSGASVGYDISYQILRDGSTSVWASGQSNVGLVTGKLVSLSISGTGLDTPSAASHTYTLSVNSSIGTGLSINTTAFWAVELKK